MYSRKIIKSIIFVAVLIVITGCDGDKDIRVAGPASMAAGGNAQYTIEYDISIPVNADRTKTFDVEMEGTKIAKAVSMFIPGGSNRGVSTPFTITCTQNGSDFTMTGPDGSVTGSSPFGTHAEMILTGGNADGIEREIACTGAPEPQSVRIINQYGETRSFMYNGVTEAFRVELTMNGSVVTAKSYNFSIKSHEVDWLWYFWWTSDRTLQNIVKVTIPAGANIGYGAFNLTCNSNGSNWDLVGLNGTAPDRPYFNIWADGVINSANYNWGTGSGFYHHIDCILGTPPGGSIGGTIGGGAIGGGTSVDGGSSGESNN